MPLARRVSNPCRPAVLDGKNGLILPFPDYTAQCHVDRTVGNRGRQWVLQVCHFACHAGPEAGNCVTNRVSQLPPADDLGGLSEWFDEQ